MAKLKKKWFFIAGGVLLVAVIVIANLNKGQNAIKVQTDKVVKGKITSSVSGSAKIQPEVQVKISAKVSGQIIKFGVKEGDAVTKGQFLVQLDQEFYQAELEQFQSNLKFSEAGYEKAKNEQARAQKLFEGKLLSEAELDMAKSTYQQSKAQVEQAQASLKQARDNLSKTTIYSPMDGVVSQVNKKVGEMAMGSQFTLDVIMVVADLNKMLAETDIDENDVVNVTLGDTAKISVDAYPDTTFLGVVSEIANTGTEKGTGTQEQVTNFLVKVSMIEKPISIRPSMSSTVEIITETKDNVLKIPIQCVTMRKPVKADSTAKAAKPKDGAPAAEDEKTIKVVFTVKNGTANQVPVETGITSDTEWEITKGLAEGDEIVSGSYRILSKTLKNGDKVKVDNSLKRQIKEGEEGRK